MNDTNIIKGCPFCGMEAKDILIVSPFGDRIGNTYVQCPNGLCRAMVRGKTKEEAINKWNRRI
jgi:Lar family restriction alleviation protein